MKIILGSQSESRRELLREMGYEFEVMPSNIDEKAIRHDNPKELVLALANAKTDALIPKISEPVLLITADQVVVWKDEIREKPENEKEAKRFLQTYHEVPAEIVNATVVTNTGTGKRVFGIDSSTVQFAKIQEKVIDELIKKGRIFSRAGGFEIRDSLLEPYVEKVEGTIDSIMGLPKTLTERLIKEAQE